MICLQLCPHFVRGRAIDHFLFMERINGSKNGDNGQLSRFSHWSFSSSDIVSTFFLVPLTTENRSLHWNMKLMCIFHNWKLAPLYLLAMLAFLMLDMPLFSAIFCDYYRVSYSCWTKLCPQNARFSALSMHSPCVPHVVLIRWQGKSAIAGSS